MNSASEGSQRGLTHRQSRAVKPDGTANTVHIPQVSRDGTICRYPNALSQLALHLVSFIISIDSLSISSISQPIINTFNHPRRNLGSLGGPFFLQNMLLAELAHFIMDLSAGGVFIHTFRNI